MTERKPPEVSVESWIDQQIRAAQERGAFDNLPGAGKPLPGLDGPRDENWWVKQKIQSEGLPTDVLLPPALMLRREVQRLPETVRDLAGEDTVREVVRELNLRIAEHIRRPAAGPFVPVVPVRVEDVVARWRREREAAAVPEPGSLGAHAPRHVPTGHQPAAETGAPAAPWWHRLLRRRRGTGGR